MEGLWGHRVRSLMGGDAASTGGGRWYISSLLGRLAGGERWYISFFFNKLAGGASAPLVPLFVITVLGGGVAEVTLAVVSVSIATVPAFVLWGDYTDRTGQRKGPILWGFGFQIVAFLVMAFSRNMVEFVAGNVLYGFFLAATVPSSTILIMEHNPEAEWGRAVGAFTKVSGIGWLVGMALGAVWFVALGSLPEVVAMRTFMLVCGLASALSWAMADRWISEPVRRIDRQWLVDNVVGMRMWAFERARHIPSKVVFFVKPRVLRKTRRLLPDWGRNLDIYLLTTIILFIGIHVFYVPFPVMLTDELHLGSSEVFTVYVVSAFTAAVMYAWAGREVDRLGNRRAQLMAWSVRAVLFSTFSLALLAMARGMEGLVFALVLALNAGTGAMFSIVSVAGITTALDLSPPRIRGEAVGAYNAVTGMGTIVGGFLGGTIAVMAGYTAVALVTGAITVVAIALLLRISFPHVPSEPSSA